VTPQVPAPRRPVFIISEAAAPKSRPCSGSRPQARLDARERPPFLPRLAQCFLRIKFISPVGATLYVRQKPAKPQIGQAALFVAAPLSPEPPPRSIPLVRRAIFEIRIGPGPYKLRTFTLEFPLGGVLCPLNVFVGRARTGRVGQRPERGVGRPPDARKSEAPPIAARAQCSHQRHAAITNRHARDKSEKLKRAPALECKKRPPPGVHKLFERARVLPQGRAPRPRPGISNHVKWSHVSRHARRRSGNVAGGAPRKKAGSRPPRLADLERFVVPGRRCGRKAPGGPLPALPPAPGIGVHAWPPPTGAPPGPERLDLRSKPRPEAGRDSKPIAGLGRRSVRDALPLTKIKINAAKKTKSKEAREPRPLRSVVELVGEPVGRPPSPQRRSPCFHRRPTTFPRSPPAAVASPPNVGPPPSFEPISPTPARPFEKLVFVVLRGAREIRG